MLISQPKKDYTLQWFLSHCYFHKYPAKSTLIHQGEKANTLYYIIKGSISILVKNKDGKEIISHYLNEGNFIGEYGFFNKNQKYKFWVRAKQNSEIAAISYKKFKKLIWINPNILIRLSHQMSNQLNFNSKKIITLEFFEIIGKLTKVLINLAKKKNAMCLLNNVQIHINKFQLSKLIGSTEEEIQKALKILEENNLIRLIKNNVILIYNF